MLLEGLVKMRIKFNEDLKHLDNMLLEMAMLNEKIITQAISLFGNKDEKVSKEVIKLEEKIDLYEDMVQKHCLKIYVQQQPAATDLRRVSAAMKMITDMERIGDNSRDIGEICMLLPDDFNKEDLSMIMEMATETKKLLKNAIDSFVNRDLESAKEIEKQDDIVDNYFVDVMNHVVKKIKEDYDPELMVNVLMIGKYLERIADHGVNIADWVIFSIEG